MPASAVAIAWFSCNSLVTAIVCDSTIAVPPLTGTAANCAPAGTSAGFSAMVAAVVPGMLTVNVPEVGL